MTEQTSLNKADECYHSRGRERTGDEKAEPLFNYTGIELDRIDEV